MANKDIEETAEYFFDKVTKDMVTDYSAYDNYSYIFFKINGIYIFEYDDVKKHLFITHPSDIIHELNGLFSWTERDSTNFIGQMITKKYNLIIKRTILDVPFT
jgi:hypothetical protein